MKQIVDILRPTHWTKNSFVFAGLVFGKKLTGTTSEIIEALMMAFCTFVAFCLMSSATYIFNDIMDREADRRHPHKSRRPIASGVVGLSQAGGIMGICILGALLISLPIDTKVVLVLGLYFSLMMAYSTGLKNVMILDCIVIAIGFCLRAIAGAMAVKVMITPWLVICTFALCLFLAFGKRRSELAQLSVEEQSFRPTLSGYTPELLAHMLDVTSGLAIVCFLLYAMDDMTKSRIGNTYLVYTSPLVLFCIFRFSALIQAGKYSGPVQFILSDRPFQIGFILWVASCVWIVY